jgi:hypothetical protein
MSDQKYIQVVEPFTTVIDASIVERARGSILLLPEDWNGDTHIYPGTTESLVKLFKKHSAPVELLDDKGSILMRDNRSTDWVSPTLFVTQLLITQDPNAVALALNIISTYVTDFFKGSKNDPTVRIKVIYSKTKTKEHREMRYEGPASKISELKDLLWETAKKD